MNDYSSQHYVNCVHSCIYLIYISARDVTRWCCEKTDLCMWKTWTLQHSAPPFLARLTPGGHLENKEKETERWESGSNQEFSTRTAGTTRVPHMFLPQKSHQTTGGTKKLSLQAAEMRGYRETSISPLPITSIRLASLEHPAPTKKWGKEKDTRQTKLWSVFPFYIYTRGLFLHCISISRRNPLRMNCTHLLHHLFVWIVRVILACIRLIWIHLWNINSCRMSKLIFSIQ